MQYFVEICGFAICGLIIKNLRIYDLLACIPKKFGDLQFRNELKICGFAIYLPTSGPHVFCTVLLPRVSCISSWKVLKRLQNIWAENFIPAIFIIFKKCKICSRQLHAASPLRYFVPPKQCPGGKYPPSPFPPPRTPRKEGPGERGRGDGEDLEDWRGPNLICEAGEEELNPGLISRGSIPLKAERIGRGGGSVASPHSWLQPATQQGPLVSLRSTSGQPPVNSSEVWYSRQLRN